MVETGGEDDGEATHGAGMACAVLCSALVLASLSTQTRHQVTSAKLQLSPAAGLLSVHTLVGTHVKGVQASELRLTDPYVRIVGGSLENFKRQYTRKRRIAELHCQGSVEQLF